jgi:hypothetical protein
MVVQLFFPALLLRLAVRQLRRRRALVGNCVEEGGRQQACEIDGRRGLDGGLDGVGLLPREVFGMFLGFLVGAQARGGLLGCDALAAGVALSAVSWWLAAALEAAAVVVTTSGASSESLAESSSSCATGTGAAVSFGVGAKSSGSSLPKRMCAFLAWTGVREASWDDMDACSLLNVDDGISSGKLDCEGETSTRVSSTSTAFLFLRALGFFAEVRSLVLLVLGVGEPAVFFCVAGVANGDSVCCSGV